MVGAYVAATLVCLVQYLRLKDRRVLVLMFLFACQAQALAREWNDFWKDIFQTGACAAGLLLLLLLTLAPRASRTAAPRGPVAAEATPAVSPPDSAGTGAPQAPEATDATNATGTGSAPPA